MLTPDVITRQPNAAPKSFASGLANLIKLSMSFGLECFDAGVVAVFLSERPVDEEEELYLFSERSRLGCDMLRLVYVPYLNSL